MKKKNLNGTKLLIILLGFLLVSKELSSQSVIRFKTSTQSCSVFNFALNQFTPAIMGNFSSGQLAGVIDSIGSGDSSIIASSNLIWSSGGTCQNCLFMDTFIIPNADTVCIDSVRYWLQCDDRVTSFRLNSVLVDSTLSGWTNYKTGTISAVSMNQYGGTYFVDLTTAASGSSPTYYFVALRLDIYYHLCP